MTTDPIARVVTAALARPLLVVLLALAGLFAGIDALSRLPRDVFPDLSTPVFNVIVQNPAMSAEELELAVAIPMERALAGLPDVRRVRSTSTLGVSRVIVEFEPDADFWLARQMVSERVAQVAPELPPGTETPLVSSLTGRLNEIFEITIEAEPGAADLMTLRDLAELEVRTRLLAVPGVAAVERLGGWLREVQVQLDPDRMAARGVTLTDVLHAIDGANVSGSGGVVRDGDVEWVVRALGRVDDLDGLRGTVVAVRDGTPIRLGDVTDVVEAPAFRRGLAHRLDGEVVSCRVSKQFGADTVEVARGIRAAVDDLRATLPPGVQVRVVYDQSELVDTALSGVGRAVAIGGLFVVLVVWLLLGDRRAAALVTAAIPLSIALAGVALGQAGVGLNTMTLGGLAIAVGLLVDASIIVCENLVHRLRAGDPWPQVAAATIEVGRPILFATLVVVAVFLPLATMEGLEGRTWRPLATAVVAAMVASLAVALTVTPVLGALWVRPQHAERGDTLLIRGVKRVYGPVLDVCLRHPLLTALAALILSAPVLGGGLLLGRDFMPRLDEGALLVQTFLPAEASLEAVDRLNHGVEDALRRVPEVVDVVRRTGRAERSEDPMPHTVSDVLVLLRPGRPSEVVEADVREALEHVPGVAASVTTPLGMRIDEGLGGTPADVQVRIFGADLDVLARLADAAASLLADVEGLHDLRVEEITGVPQLAVAIDRTAAARAGLTPGDVVEALRIGLVGDEVSTVWRGSRSHALVVKLREDRRTDPAAVRSLWVDAHDGTRIPLDKLASIRSTTGPGTIQREASSRRVAIEAAVVGRDLAGAAADVEHALAGLEVPPGYFWDVGGRVETARRATRSLVLALGLAAFAVVLLLLVAIDDVRHTAVVLVSLPTALTGGILLLALWGLTWNVSSLVGLVGLLGIAVQNGLVLVTQVRGLRDAGLPFAAAVREASLGRVRPKLMTAGTAILGLVPMLVLDLHGTEIERPLAVVMVGGLVTSTLFTLLALPACLVLAGEGRRPPR